MRQRCRSARAAFVVLTGSRQAAAGQHEVLTMQFILLLYGDEAAEAALTDAERRAIVDAHIAFSRRLRERGAWVAGDAVEPSTRAAWVRDGKATDGPFAETKEQLGGYYVVECASRDDAIEVAREVPASPGSVVEIRPLAEV
jgi:hypothetical protein